MCAGSPQCPISLRVVEEYRNMYWIDGSGSCCQQYTRMNQSAAGMLSMDVLTCLVHVYSLRYYEPDQVLHECVPAFDLSVIFGPLLHIHDIAKCTLPLATYCSLSPMHYDTSQQTFEPTDIGVPARRRRSYSGANFLPRVKQMKGGEI